MLQKPTQANLTQIYLHRSLTVFPFFKIGISDEHLTLESAKPGVCKGSARRKEAQQASQLLAGSPQVSHTCKLLSLPCSRRTQALPGPLASREISGMLLSGVLLVALTPRLQITVLIPP